MSDRKTRKTNPLTEEQLLSILKDEEADAASFYSSELADVQTQAMNRYHARPFGDEIEGRSKVVDHATEDTINWMMPKLMRALMQADELVSCEDPASDDQGQAKCAADYLRHIFFKDNDGETIVHDFAFDALLQRVGNIRVTWADPQPKPPRVLEGVSIEVLQKYIADPEYQILEQETEDEQTYALKVQHTPKMGRCVVENIPPEEYAFSRRARSSRAADYQRWKREMFLADLMRQYPEYAHQLSPDGDRASDDSNRETQDSRLDARFPDEPSTTTRTETQRAGRRKVWLIEEEIRVDFDGDGITELRHIKRVGDVILENIEIERSEFHVWTPIRIAHRMVGRSLHDTIADLTRIRTVILRNTLDSMSQSLVPRTVVNTALVEDDTIAALLDADIGGVIRVKGNAQEAIFPLVSPDLSAQGLQMLEYMDQRSEEATGVTRHAQGLAPDAITDTKGGIEALQGAANERIELVARWLAKGLQHVFESILHNICAHQDGPRLVKIKGRAMQIDPRIWSDEMAVEVSTGMATENRQTRLNNLSMLEQKQASIITQAGSDNPLCGVSEYRTTLAMLTEAMGFKSPERFFKEIPDDYQAPAPMPDPKVALEQSKFEFEQQKAQHAAELERTKAEQAAQLEREKYQFQTQVEAARAETDERIAVLKIQGEQRIAEMRIAAETDLAWRRAVMEKEFSRWKAERDFDDKKAARNVTATTNGVATGGDVRMGGTIG